MTPRILLVLPLFAACAQAYPIPGVGDDDGDDDGVVAPDAAPGSPDGAPGSPDATEPAPDGAPAAAAAAPLLLSEILLAPSAAEFIEIANLTGAAVDLSDYYLSDAGTYFRLPTGDAGVAASDFIVRFPAGATLAAGDVAVIALDTTSAFQTAAGVAPD